MYCFVREGESESIYELGITGESGDRFVDVSEEVVRKIGSLSQSIEIISSITILIQPFRTDLQSIVRALDSEELARLASVINIILEPKIQDQGFVYAEQQMGGPVQLRKTKPE